ncbi:sensor histidine kinase [Amycolatopsis sp. RTGN1]|uniref:sensor histidine kinase n=1 Tax=Amycolatopsis ponsaeliensis TaxID=2992142 RepID=UPI00254BDB45|nr:histidine kinase [Amycolatopsis sp. RTGN1]
MTKGPPPTMLARARTSLQRQSLLVAVVCVGADVLSFVTQDLPAGSFAWTVALLAIVAADAALATSTKWSGVTAVAAVAVNVGAAVLLGGPADLRLNEAGVLVASYRAGAWLRGTQAVATLGAVIGGLVFAHLARGYTLDWHVAVAAAKIGLVSWLVGRYTTARRAYLEEMRRQAEQEKREAQAEVDRAVTEDRAAIARDLHDVVTHHVSAISVHAGAARLRLTRTGGDQSALASVCSVENSSRSALHDLRHMLDLLLGQRPKARRDPGLDDVGELLESLRSTGIAVRLETTGTPPALPGPLDAALFRIVQEMLTNALRHGSGGPIDVAIRHSAGRLEVETVNPFPATGEATAEGRGLTGIRARAQAFAGRPASGPRPDGRTWRTAVSFDLGDPA